MDINDILSIIQQEVSKASKDKQLDELNRETDDRLHQIKEKLKNIKDVSFSDIPLVPKTSTIDNNTIDRIHEYIDSLPVEDNKDQDSDQDNEDSNDSQSFDYGAYRERLDSYVQQERERELEDSVDEQYQSSGASYDADGFTYPEELHRRTTICLGNDLDGGPGGVLDGVYTSQLSYINGKKWYKLTSPTVDGSEPTSDTTIKYTSGAWRIGIEDEGTIYYSNTDSTSPLNISGWIRENSTWPVADLVNIYECNNAFIESQTLEFNFTYSTYEVQDQYIGIPTDPESPYEAIPWTLTPEPENYNISVTVEFDFSGTASSVDIDIDPKQVGITSDTKYTRTLTPLDAGTGFSEFRVVRDPLSANIDGTGTFFIRFVSGSDTTGQKTISAGSVSAVEVSIID